MIPLKMDPLHTSMFPDYFDDRTPGYSAIEEVLYNDIIRRRLPIETDMFLYEAVANFLEPMFDEVWAIDDIT